MIELKNIKKNYKDKMVLRGVNLKLEDGIIYGIVGANGVGKTTLLQIIAGFIKPTSGNVIINGVKNFQNEKISRLGYVPDDAVLYEYLTGEEYLLFAAAMFDIPVNERKKRVEEFLNLFKLDQARDHIISSYSKGMRQKLALASAMIHQPYSLLLDEPLTGVDMISSEIIKAYLCQFVKNKTILLATHLLELAHSICHKIAILSHGVIVQEFSTDEISLKEIQKYVRNVYLNHDPTSNGSMTTGRPS